MVPISMNQKIKVMELACRKAEFQEGFEDIYSRMIGQLTGNGVEGRPVVECIEGPIPSAKHECCERWLQFLDETIGDAVAIAQLQEFFGYCLLPTMRYPKALLLSGTGYGKSTLGRVLRHMVGEENSAFGIDLALFGSQLGRGCLFSNRLVISDVESIGRLDDVSGVIKSILSGESVTVGIKHANPFITKLHGKLVFVSRNITRDDFRENDGLRRRMLFIRFEHEPPHTDPDLTQKLHAEYDGIMQWAVEGLRQLLNQNQFTEIRQSSSR